MIGLISNPRICPVCLYALADNNWRMHMKNHHGWRYNRINHVEYLAPQEIGQRHFLQSRDSKGRFMKKENTK